MNLKDLTRKQAQYIGYVVFLFIYVGLSFSWMLPKGYGILLHLPTAFFIGLIGYWIGGFLHKRVIRSNF